MPHTQSQYQVRFALGANEAVTADIVCWADAFALHTPPVEALTLTLRNRTALAEAILREQERRNARTSVLIVAAPGTPGGAFPVANLAAAGALVESLSELGIDHTSPEAAAIRSLWVGIAPALRHLLGASGDARALAAAGEADRVARALELDSEIAIAPLG